MSSYFNETLFLIAEKPSQKFIIFTYRTLLSEITTLVGNLSLKVGFSKNHIQRKTRLDFHLQQKQRRIFGPIFEELSRPSVCGGHIEHATVFTRELMLGEVQNTGSCKVSSNL